MKTLSTRFPLPEGLRTAWPRLLWTALWVTALGCGAGLVSLLYAAQSVQKLARAGLFSAYLGDGLLLALNLWPAVLLAWLFYFLTRRAWAGFLGAYLPVTALAAVNYYKIQLRGDPLVIRDLKLASEAAGIMGRYELEVNWLVWLAAGALLLGLALSVLLVPRGPAGWPERALGALSAAALLAVSFLCVYLDDGLYQRLEVKGQADAGNGTELYLSKGGLYPLLHSAREMIYTAPEGYDSQQAAVVLERYEDADIPPERRVSVMGIMLEAFADLTDFPALAAQEKAAQVYEPWHALAGEGVSGRLLTNIFAGGTVDSEWAFLTGYSSHGEFTKTTDSYVWYFRDQGYQTFGSHPGFAWFYDREDINRYLGFEEYWFSENHYGQLVDPVAAQWNSDQILMRELLQQLQERVQEGPCFSFSVSYQNHGPYSWDYTEGERLLTPEGSGFSQATCNIWNNYLNKVADTLDALTGLVQGLEEMEQPVVLVVFGDHKPWGGNGNDAYFDLGTGFSLSTTEGFYDYYATPYLIWANSAAKQVLGRDFSGPGGDFSPCFLMAELFEQCGWEGPAFLQLSQQMRQRVPLVHTSGKFLVDGQLSASLPPEDQELLDEFLRAEYFREQAGHNPAMEETAREAAGA